MKQILWLLVGLSIILFFRSTKPQPSLPPLRYSLSRPSLPPVLPPVIRPVEPVWTEYLPQRQVTHLGIVLSDIESHLPENHIYRDEDKVTSVHESSHGIASDLRQKYHQSEKPINAFYCLNNKAVIIEEPNIHISDVAERVPLSLRGGTYSRYLTQSPDWENQPLYLADEWIAYTNGAAARKDFGIKDRAETVTFMLEFDIYAITLAMTVQELDPAYDDRQLKAFLVWNIERSMAILDSETESLDYIAKLRTSSDAETFRVFARKYFGQDWTGTILKI